jgi:SAM-dependent methyltransferase
MREKLSLLKLALGDLEAARKIARGAREARGALLAKLVEVLEPELKRPWHGWADGELARYVYEVLVGEGVARWRGDALELVEKPAPPRITLPEAADAVSAFSRIIESRLLDALEGRRKYFTDREQIALYARFLDNLGYNWFRKLALSLLLPKELRRSEQAVFVDVGAGLGLSTLALLELTRGTVVAIDPYEENLENVRDYAELKRAGHRVRVVRGYAEDFKLEAPADAAVMINVLHWCNSPQLALRNAAANVKRGGFVAVMQAVRDAKEAWTGIIPAYLLGAPRLPPTRSELYRMVKEEGLKVEKSYSLPAELVLAKVP